MEESLHMTLLVLLSRFSGQGLHPLHRETTRCFESIRT